MPFGSSFHSRWTASQTVSSAPVPVTATPSKPKRVAWAASASGRAISSMTAPSAPTLRSFDWVGSFSRSGLPSEASQKPPSAATAMPSRSMSGAGAPSLVTATALVITAGVLVASTVRMRPKAPALSVTTKSLPAVAGSAAAPERADQPIGRPSTSAETMVG